MKKRGDGKAGRLPRMEMAPAAHLPVVESACLGSIGGTPPLGILKENNKFF
jgi:hypothetical protein